MVYCEATVLIKMPIPLGQLTTWSNRGAITTSSDAYARIQWSVIAREDCGLSYEYQNEPTAGASSTTHPHRGTAWLQYDERNQRLAGENYSGRDRQNIGTITVGKKV